MYFHTSDLLRCVYTSGVDVGTAGISGYYIPVAVIQILVLVVRFCDTLKDELAGVPVYVLLVTTYLLLTYIEVCFKLVPYGTVLGFVN